MLDKFLRRRRSVSDKTETEDLAGLLASMPGPPDSCPDVNKPEKILSPCEIDSRKRTRRKDDAQSMMISLKNAQNMTSLKNAQISFVSESREATIISSDSGRPFLNEDPDAALTMRRTAVMNAATRSVEIKYSPASAALHLPRSFRLVADLYKVLVSIHAFNQRRGLALILIKYIGSIESLFKHRVDTAVLEQLNFICNGAIIFVPVRVTDEGVKKDTFRIEMRDGFDVDMALFNHYSERYGAWLAANGIEGRVVRFHPDFIREECEVPRKALTCVEEVKEAEIKAVAKSKAETILERIRERERLRKEEFVKGCTARDDCGAKLDGIFSVVGRQAMKLEELVFKVGGFEPRARILGVLGEKYTLRVINGEEYVVSVDRKDN